MSKNLVKFAVLFGREDRSAQAGGSEGLQESI